MLERLFIQIVNMSITGSIVILAVILARLALKRAPRAISYALWAVVLLRLTCPFTLPGAWSLPVSPSPISPDIVHIETSQTAQGSALANDLMQDALPSGVAGADTSPLQTGLYIAQFVWLGGIAAMAVYSAVSLIRLRRRLVGAVRMRSNIYLADHIETPFVLGLIRPKIYLPSTLGAREQTYVIAHEQAHIRRLDPAVKVAAFAVLAVHWFNPLVWAAFVLCTRDMEASCDERVLRHADANARAEYSASLLSLAAGRRIIAGTPLAFGEGSVKGRVRNVLNYRRPALWLTLVAVVAAALLGVWLLSGPSSSESLRAGYYTYETPDSQNPTVLSLQPDQEFTLSSPMPSSYSTYGAYQQEGSRLICRTQDQRFTYVFKIKGERLTFLARESSEMQDTDGSPVPDGAVFAYDGDLPTEVEKGIIPEGIDAPAAVLEQAKAYVAAQYADSGEAFPEYAYTDWRIESLERVYTYELDGLTLDIYQLDFKLRSEAPEKIAPAGGMHIADENWVCIDYPNSRFIVYDRDAEVSRAVMFENDCAPGDEIFTADLRAALAE